MHKIKNPRLKRILLAGAILLLAAGGVYWYLHSETWADTKDKKADFTVNANDFIKEFLNDLPAANVRYTGKIVTVNGIVSEIEAADTTVNIKFIDTVSRAYAIFDFQSQYSAEANTLKVGQQVSIKGSCSGGVFSPLRETTVINFQRCTLDKN